MLITFRNLGLHFGNLLNITTSRSSGELQEGNLCLIMFITFYSQEKNVTQIENEEIAFNPPI